MALFCVPKKYVDKLKNSILRGKVDVQKLYDMTSAERRAFFSQHTEDDLGRLLNTEFEKAMASKKRTALSDFVKSTFDPKSKNTTAYKNVLDKIKQLDDDGLLNPKAEKGLLEDLVADKLGVSVTPEQINIIKTKAERIGQAQVKLGDDLGNPAKLDENLNFWVAKKEMDDYLQGLTPTPLLRVATGTIGRGSMLFSVKSPILNIGSNIEVGFTEMLARRLSGGGLRGANNKLAVDYVKMVNKIYRKTGYDISRMTSLADTGASGARVLGEDMVHTQGPGFVRGFARKVSEDIVFKNLMGAPDVAFSSAHFADSVNMAARRVAKGDSKLASEMMTDAMRLQPRTAVGEALRTQGILDAQVATWTNKSWASEITRKLRKVFNEASGDLRLGDNLFPFIKTPANVISTGMDYAGMGIPKAMIKLRNAIKTGELRDPGVMQSIARDLVRSGLGITGAVMVVSQLKDEDFVGAYDPARAQIEQLRGSRDNSIRIGGKWISTDWLGPLSVPVTAMMYARKYGKKGWGERIFQYSKGVTSQFGQLPVISDVVDYIRTSGYKTDQTLEEMGAGATNNIVKELYSRMVPSFVSDVAKMTDTNQRVSNKNLDSVIASLPGRRKSLEEKKNIFGETLKNEPWLSTLLFGSRVKTSTETPVATELSRLSTELSTGINFTNWDKTTSKTIAQFKQKKADKFDEAKALYGSKLKARLEKEFAKPSYQKLTDEEKLKLVNGLDADVQKEVFDKYNFKYDSKQKVSAEARNLSVAGSYEKSEDSSSNFFDLVATYGKGFSVDPVATLRALVGPEHMRKVVGDATIVERKKFLNDLQATPEGYVLDHIIPLSLGGTNSLSNLRAYPKDVAAKADIEEKKLAKMLREGKIGKDEARKRILAVKGK